MDPWLLERLAAHSVELPPAYGALASRDTWAHSGRTLDLLTEGSEIASSRWVPSQANSVRTQTHEQTPS